jgi:hypothetical protein
MRVRISTLLTLFAGTLAACASRGPLGVAVPPGKIYAGPYLTVTAPQSPGWRLIESNASGMIFGRDGQTSDESYIAQVGSFPVPPRSTPAELESLVRTSAREGTDPVRFKVRRETFQSTSVRGYPCVTYHSIAEDAAPQTRSGSPAPLLLEMRALYCQHPIKRDLGFTALYSHRGTSLQPHLGAEADAFIQGVMVTQQ